MALLPPANAAGAFGLSKPTEADLHALLSKTAGLDVSDTIRRARAAVGVPAGPLSLDALEQVARAVVAAGSFPTTISARSFLIRIGSFRALSLKHVPASTTARPVAV